MNVLFIEDDPMNRRVVKDMLDVAGASMSEAEDGPAGLRMIEEEDFQVVLVDLSSTNGTFVDGASPFLAGTVQEAILPEPSTFALAAGGLALAGLAARRRRRAAEQRAA